eukprot:4427688-Amphidinium_carterae.1
MPLESVLQGCTHVRMVLQDRADSEECEVDLQTHLVTADSLNRSRTALPGQSFNASNKISEHDKQQHPHPFGKKGHNNKEGV